MSWTNSDWEILVNFAWPHDRFRLGWEVIQPTEEEPIASIMIDLFFVAILYNKYYEGE